MKYLAEHQFGFDAAQLGFPSIAACRAIVYQTVAGLYGYHMYYGYNAANNAVRAADFANFINTHNGGGGVPAGQYLFVVTYTEMPVTGYSANSLTDWQAEAANFAAALGFVGRRMGVSLSPKTGALSSYVQFDQAVGMAKISAAPWVDDPLLYVKAVQPPAPDFGWNGQQVPKSCYTAIAPLALTTHNPQMLD